MPTFHALEVSIDLIPGHTTESGPDFADYAVDPPGAGED